MKRMKSALAVLLAVLMTALLATAAFAAPDNVVLSGTAGKNVNWVLTDDGVLTVSGNGPIEDKTETEVDEDGNTILTIVDSISMTFAAYYETLVEGMDAATAARTRFALVKEIIVEDGITAIPQDEFYGMYPRFVTLPSTLNEVGFDSIELKFTEGLTISSVTLQKLPLYVSAYENDAEPYADLDTAIEAFIAQKGEQEQYDYDLLPFDALHTYADVYYFGDDANWNNMDEDAKQEMLDIYNAYLGTEATNLAELVPAALDKLNEQYGTTFTSVEEIFNVETDDDGNTELVPEENLRTMISEEMERVNDTSRLVNMSIGAENDWCTANDWITVTAPAGGEIEKACKISGINFKALEGVTVPTADAELCPLCGKDHSGNALQKIVGVFHQALYKLTELLRGFSAVLLGLS